LANPKKPRKGLRSKRPLGRRGPQYEWDTRQKRLEKSRSGFQGSGGLRTQNKSLPQNSWRGFILIVEPVNRRGNCRISDNKKTGGKDGAISREGLCVCRKQMFLRGGKGKSLEWAGRKKLDKGGRAERKAFVGGGQNKRKGGKPASFPAQGISRKKLTGLCPEIRGKNKIQLKREYWAFGSI